MEKGRKLRRYNRKDYTQLVDFPVEIVGRDGVVRRYSFEESIRLYQRRIASASLRYEDGEIAQAEVQHCQRRIEQLRRSYFARYGWDAIRAMDGAGPATSGLSAEVAAFLRRTFDRADGDPESVTFNLVDQSEHHRLFFVNRAEPAPARYLLYVYRFDGAESSPAREAFFKFLKVLQSARRSGEGVEALVGFHHANDCGLILTGKSPNAPELVEAAETADGPNFEVVEGQEDPLREALVHLRHGRNEEALSCFTATYEDHHFRRSAYVGATVVADLLGRFEEAETAALMGQHYFPTDGTLIYHLAVTRLRQHRAAEALDDLDRLPMELRSSTPALLVRAMALLSLGQLGAGRRELGRAWKVRQDGDEDLGASLRLMRARLTARDLTSVVGYGLICGGLGVLYWAGSLALLLPLAGALLLVGIRAAWTRQMRRWISEPGQTGLRLAHPAAPGGARAEAQ